MVATSKRTTYVVYRLTSKTSGKSYVGKTKELKARLMRHKSYAMNGSPFALHAAIRKYGYDDFELTIVRICLHESEAFALERETIRIEGTRAPAGYNMTDGGEGASGYFSSDETKQKRSRSLSGRAPCEATKKAAIAYNTGRKRSEEARRKQSESVRGKSKSAEHRAKIAAAMRGRRRAPFSEEWRRKLGDATRGIPRSPEAAKKISEALKGRPCSEETREKIRAAWVRWRERRAQERFEWLLVDEQ